MGKNDMPRQMVMATATGFYRNALVERGTTFALLSVSDFSPSWMKKVDESAPDMIPATDPRRASRPGERPALSALTPLPTPAGAKPGDRVTVPAMRTADQAVI
jgi:hypothetical protein